MKAIKLTWLVFDVFTVLKMSDSCRSNCELWMKLCESTFTPINMRQSRVLRTIPVICEMGD